MCYFHVAIWLLFCFCVCVFLVIGLLFISVHNEGGAPVWTLTEDKWTAFECLGPAEPPIQLKLAVLSLSEERALASAFPRVMQCWSMDDECGSGERPSTHALSLTHPGGILNISRCQIGSVVWLNGMKGKAELLKERRNRTWGITIMMSVAAGEFYSPGK